MIVGMIIMSKPRWGVGVMLIIIVRKLIIVVILLGDDASNDE